MTINAEQRARIRRLFFAEHWKIGTIVAELGVHPDTVKRAIGTDTFVSNGEASRQSLIDPFKPFIVQTLEDHPRLRSTRLFDMLRGRGFEGSERQLRRYVAKVRPVRRPEAYLRLMTMPGEQAQMDWAHFGILDVPGGQRRLSLFVLVLSFSRRLFARFTLDQRMDSFLRGHRLAFEAFGGVPRQILYDNLKTVVLERVGERVQFHPAVLEFAGHYHYVPRPCAPYRPNEKGSVERAVQYIRGSFFEGRTYRDLDDLNAQLARWIRERADARVHPTDEDKRTVAEVFDQEQPRLLPLPANAPSTDQVVSLRSSKRPYLRFDGNDYSIPHTLVRQWLTVVADESEVRVLDGQDVVAAHARSFGKRQVLEDMDHIDPLVLEKKRAMELRGRDRLRALCPHAGELLDALAVRNEPIRQRTARLNKLLDLYGEQALDLAIAEALGTDAPSVGTVAYLLEKAQRRARVAPPLGVQMPAHVRDKDVVVVPHDMGEYDRLGRAADPEDERGEP